MCSITYSIGNEDESFEWYNVRKANRKECRLLDGKVSVSFPTFLL